MIILFQVVEIAEKVLEINNENALRYVISGLVLLLGVAGYVIQHIWSRHNKKLDEHEKSIQELRSDYEKRIFELQEERISQLQEVFTVMMNTTNVMKELTDAVSQFPNDLQGKVVEIKQRIADAEASLNRSIGHLQK